MNKHFNVALIASRRMRLMLSSNAKRKNTKQEFNALGHGLGATINDGNGIASPGAVSAVRSANAVTHSPNGGEQRP